MPTVWISFKKSLHCKSESSDVHDPKTRTKLSTILTRKAGRSGCSRSIANLKDVFEGSKRHFKKPPSCSPRSIGSSEFLNPITHEVTLSNSRCELKITENGGSKYVGTLRHGTPGPTTMQYFNPSFNVLSIPSPPRRKSSFLVRDKDGPTSTINGCGVIQFNKRVSHSKGSSSITCHKCGEQFTKWDAVEAHHLSNHAVTELVEGDSSRKIVEIICRTGWLKFDHQSTRIERIVKVHNMQNILARFEEYRESVKIKASILPKKHPRCLADGNELLRFYGTTLACPLGQNGFSSLCVSEKCCVCRIIRNGFSTEKELKNGVGVFTASTSVRAYESIEVFEPDPSVRKALMVCRVIAGRVHRPLENIQEISGQTGFDSLAGKIGLYSNIEELYLLNPRALLPCFVVICKS